MTSDEASRARIAGNCSASSAVPAGSAITAPVSPVGTRLSASAVPAGTDALEGVHGEVERQVACASAVVTSVVSSLSPAPDANKYTRGRLVVVAGSARYPGAAVLAARAGQRMGAGYTEVITHERAVDIVRAAGPSLVVRSFGQWSPDFVPASREGKPCALCIGPGFEPGNEESGALVASVLKVARCSVLVDGGALAALGAKKARKRLARRAEDGLATVVTPHGGEAARLAQAYGVSADMPAAELSAALASALHAVVVLKGPDTFISDGERTQPMYEGTAALAKAGTGDVLAGMVAALLAQGADALDSAVAGAVLHARAGVVAAERFTSVSVIPEDIIDAIPAALALET